MAGRSASEFGKEPGAILVLTVLAEKHYVERTMAAGANAHMTKPFAIDAFLEAGSYPAAKAYPAVGYAPIVAAGRDRRKRRL